MSRTFDPPWQPCASPGWRKLQVKRAFSVTLGKMLQSRPATSSDAEVAYLKAQHVKWDGVQLADLPTMWASETEINGLLVKQGDLLVCEGGEVGRAAIVETVPLDRTIIQNALHLVRGKNATEPRFLNYLLRHAAEQGWFDVICNKSTITHFTVEKIEGMWIWLPDNCQQRAIADYLDRETARLDALVAAKERLLDLLAEKRRALITQAVTRGLDAIERPFLQAHPGPVATANRHGAEAGGGRDHAPVAGGCGVSRVTEPPWQPCAAAGWRRQQIKRVFTVTLGKMLQSNLALTSDTEVAYLKAQHVQWDGINMFDLPTMWASEEEINALLVKQGDLLVCEGGEVGRAAIVGGPPKDRTIIQNALHRVRGRNGTEPRFLNYLLRHAFDQGWFDVICNRSTIAHFTVEKFEGMWIWLPDNCQQRVIADYLDRETTRLDTLSSMTEDTIALIKERRAALISAAVTGQIDVKEEACKLRS